MLFDFFIPAITDLAILLDGVSTYLAIQRGYREGNPRRRWFISELGRGAGSVGVSVACAIALALSWPGVRSLFGDPSAGLVYMTVTSYAIYATFQNLKRK